MADLAQGGTDIRPVALGSSFPGALQENEFSPVSAHTEQRKLAAIIPLSGTDMVGYPDRSGAQRNEALAYNSRPREETLLQHPAGA